jgi:hypothetical protein
MDPQSRSQDWLPFAGPSTGIAADAISIPSRDPVGPQSGLTYSRPPHDPPPFKSPTILILRGERNLNTLYGPGCLCKASGISGSGALSLFNHFTSLPHPSTIVFFAQTVPSQSLSSIKGFEGIARYTRSSRTYLQDHLMPLPKRKGTSLLQISILRLSFDVVDITGQLVKKWSRPVPATNLPILHSHFQRPLEDDEKIPISQEEFDWVCASHSAASPQLLLSHEELSTLYRVSANEHAPEAHRTFLTAIYHVPPTSGTDRSFIWTWDTNISRILQLISSTAYCVRDDNRGTSTGSYRPDYGLLLKGHCIFRGEEEAPDSTGDPKRELLDKVTWSYDLPYILGLLWILLRFERVLMQMVQDITQYPRMCTMLQLCRRL